MYEELMQKCIDLAKQAEGKVSPNPLVGAIVLDKYGTIIGKGFHQKYGEAHAEVHALNQAGDKAKGGTIVVNLEPCSHFGKTPPCADLIIEKGIKKLIVGMVDPNPVVSGRGIQKCKDAGIEVQVGILEEKCRELNEIFIKNQTAQKPFIAVKIATTLDGKIATKTGSSKWITNSNSRERVQQLRNKYDAILTGSGTVIADDPSMLCTAPHGKNPIKIILDTNAKIPAEAKVFKEGKIILATTKQPEQIPPNTDVLICPKNQENMIDLEFLVAELYKKGIRSILVEAGAKVNSAFLKTKLMDKLYHFIAPKILGDNQAISCFEGFNIATIDQTVNITLTDIEKLNGDVIITYDLRL